MDRLEQLMMHDSVPMLCGSQHPQSIMSRGVNLGFATICAALSFLNKIFFRKLLSYGIHFSSPVINLFKDGPVPFHFSSDSQMEIRSIKFFSVN